MPLMIKNGRIITSTDDYTADIYCAGDTISRIEKSIDPGSCAAGTEVIDAAGKYVFPGFIDPHVHVYLPFMGTYAKDDPKRVASFSWCSRSPKPPRGPNSPVVGIHCTLAL